MELKLSHSQPFCKNPRNGSFSSLKALKLKHRSVSVALAAANGATTTVVPDDFRCPVSGELMRESVVLATGQAQAFASTINCREGYGNNLSGSIPRELGKLFHLISLDLYNNQLSGHIPPTLGKLKSLKFMRLNSNKLTGKIPIQVILLIQWGNLQIMNVSDNQLAGSVQHHTNIIGFAATTIIQDAKA